MNPVRESRYVDLLQSIQAGLLSEPAFLRPPSSYQSELEIQSLWFSGQFGREFTTTDGRPVRIKQFGEWNRCAGPDFQQVAVEIDEEIRHGSLELDTSPLDWEHHGHSTNADYDEVCLHVCMEDDAGRQSFTRTSKHQLVPRVVLSNEALSQALNQPRYAQALSHPGRCSTPLADFAPESIESLLQAAARHRMRRKALRYSRSEDAHGSDESLYQAIASCLGYQPNQTNLLCLAQRVPLSTLRSRPGMAESLLFGAAGFLNPQIHEKASDESRDYLRQLWENWWKYRDEFLADESRLIPWHFAGLRPVNHLHRRLGALACLVDDWDAFRAVCRKATDDTKPLVDYVANLRHPHWSHHYTLNSARATKPIAILGAQRAKDFLINYLFPRRLLQEESVWNQYLDLRAAAPDQKVKRALVRLMGPREDAKDFTRFAWQQQGLLQVYQDFCLNDHSDCQECPFPEQLRQWSDR